MSRSLPIGTVTDCYLAFALGEARSRMLVKAFGDFK